MTQCWLEVRRVCRCFLRPGGRAAGRLIKGLQGWSGFAGGPSAPARSLLKGCLVIPALPFLSAGEGLLGFYSIDLSMLVSE